MLIKRENNGRWKRGNKKWCRLEIGGILVPAVVARKGPSMSRSNSGTPGSFTIYQKLPVCHYASERQIMIFNHSVSKHTCDSVLGNSYRGMGSPSPLSLSDQPSPHAFLNPETTVLFKPKARIPFAWDSATEKTVGNF